MSYYKNIGAFFGPYYENKHILKYINKYNYFSSPK